MAGLVPAKAFSESSNSARFPPPLGVLRTHSVPIRVPPAQAIAFARRSPIWAQRPLGV